MGRSRRSHGIHLEASRSERVNHAGEPVTYIKALCGEEAGAHWSWTNMRQLDEFEAHPAGQCSECAKKHALAKLKAMPELSLGEPIKAPESAWSGYKSIYPAIYKGEVVGLITIEHGWGKPWSVECFRAGYEDWRGGYDVKQGLPSKYSALVLVPELVAAGRLETKAAIEAKEVAYKWQKVQADEIRIVEHEAWARNKAAKDAERARQLAETAEGLEAIARRDLSSAERAALAAAYREITGKDLPCPSATELSHA